MKALYKTLLEKSKQAMLSAVSIYNNPIISFKTEIFIVNAEIAWTYLFHAFYNLCKIDYAYYTLVNRRKKYTYVENKRRKMWELSKCIDCTESPLDESTKSNLNFIIMLRNEIEHSSCKSIDDCVSAKIQACCINYNYYLKKLFGPKEGLDSKLAISVQFSELDPFQKKQLINNPKLDKTISNFVTNFERKLSKEIIGDSRYAYRVCFVETNVNRPGQADKVLKFIKKTSETEEGINLIIKETEKKKYLPSDIVRIIKNEGYQAFNMTKHTEIWKKVDGKSEEKHFGVRIAKTWYWYDSWLNALREYLKSNPLD